MPFLDLLLNLAGLLFWMGWRSGSRNAIALPGAASLVGTLKVANAGRNRRWWLLGALGALLAGRALVYWQVGAAVDWTPRLEFPGTAVPFRSDRLGLAFLFSALSFAQALGVFFTWLVFLSIVNGRNREGEALQRVVLQQLGRLASWPCVLQAVLPLFVVALAWVVLHPMLAWCGVAPATPVTEQTVEQGLVIGVGFYLTLRHLIVACLLAHLVNTYVYLGSHPLWTFVSATGVNLLAPLSWLPLRVGFVDFLPVVCLALVYGLSRLAMHWLPRLYPL